MGKINLNHIDNYDEEPIKHQKIKKRTRTEGDEMPKQKPRSKKQR